MKNLLMTTVFFFSTASFALEESCSGLLGIAVHGQAVTGYRQPFAQPSFPCEQVTSVCIHGLFVPSDLYPACTEIQ